MLGRGLLTPSARFSAARLAMSRCTCTPPPHEPCLPTRPALQRAEVQLQKVQVPQALLRLLRGQRLLRTRLHLRQLRQPGRQSVGAVNRHLGEVPPTQDALWHGLSCAPFSVPPLARAGIVATSVFKHVALGTASSAACFRPYFTKVYSLSPAQGCCAAAARGHPDPESERL